MRIEIPGSSYRLEVGTKVKAITLDHRLGLIRIEKGSDVQYLHPSGVLMTRVRSSQSSTNSAPAATEAE
jgi:hypothetical protein